jgi:effector-binding domain-containing protein
MLSEPKVEYRQERHFLAISKTVHMYDIPEVLPPLIPEVKTWMIQNYIVASGPDFFLYRSMNEQNELECEAGFTVREAVSGQGRIQPGSFPAGSYASIIYTGDFKDMMQGHIALEQWIKEQGLKEKIHASDGKVRWGGRTEFYLVDPDNEPDPDRWRTEITFLLED